MNNKKIAHYGSWNSPITADLISKSANWIGFVVLDGEDTYWTELRPNEGGRQVIVRRSTDGQTSDINPKPYNVRSRVHEYGGGHYTVAGGVVYFVNFQDQRLYKQLPGTDPEPVTPKSDIRYADMLVDVDRNHLICVREDHSSEGEAVNTLVSISLGEENTGHVLVSGNDFYASPRLNPDGRQLAWLTWNHPNMPWDGTELWLAEVNPDGSLEQARLVTGGVDDSIFQPEWSPDGILYFISDRTGWWNLYRVRNHISEPLCEMEAEFGWPQWVFGMSRYAFLSKEQIICAYDQDGVSHLAELNLDSCQLLPIDLSFSELNDVRSDAGRLVITAATHKEFRSVMQLTQPEHQLDVFRRSNELIFDEGYLSFAQAVEFPTERDQTAYAYFYPPYNKDYEAPPGEKPPLIVFSHGGPTGMSSATLNLGKQYWTSRGFAVIDVNYGGSTGYGRAYRQRLNGLWGIVDVEDCINAARYLVEQGLVDGDRMAIRGGSAGGYTTLRALTSYDLFAVGASYFGVSDLEALAKDTHKFESRYLDSMIGPYPEQADLYRERSPIYHVDQLSCALILFQGLEDKVVLPNQAEMMVEAVRKKGFPVAYLPFEGEQHGFRRAENAQRTLEAELYFYGKIFGFDIADDIDPVEIENL